MLLRGLHEVGRAGLAHEIALNHVGHVTAAFKATGTLWENYAPDLPGTGCSAKDFVGWTGVPPVAVLLEDVFGLEPRPPARIRWDIRILEAHGVERYPLGADTLVDLHCAARPSAAAEPEVTVRASRPVQIEAVWSGGSKVIVYST
jgi:hypothetical protein